MYAFSLRQIIAVLAMAHRVSAQVNTTATMHVCAEIARVVSSASLVSYPGSTTYDDAISHASSSSSEASVCAFEPGTAADVGKALKILGATKTPFAVKGGGHAQNRGFSSTLGVQMSLARLDGVSFTTSHPWPNLAPNGVVTFGAGLLWDDIYAYLDPFNVTVVGGRAAGVGAAGFTLGGGFSFFSNQHGLTVDTVLAFELVDTNGGIRNVTLQSDPDLFWALKGGGNNLGVVTKFTVKAIPYNGVWGGLLVHSASVIPTLTQLLLDWQTNVKDPKAAILVSFLWSGGAAVVTAHLFYDGATPPAGLFDGFLALPVLVPFPVGTYSMSSFLKATQGPSVGENPRGTFQSLTVPKFTPELIQKALDEITHLGTTLPNDTATLAFSFEPFLPGYLSQPARTSNTSAWPPASLRSSGGWPLLLSSVWFDPTKDALQASELRASVDRVQALVGQLLPRYPNYALQDQPMKSMFASADLERLKKVARRVDPGRVMKLTGGFKM